MRSGSEDRKFGLLLGTLLSSTKDLSAPRKEPLLRLNMLRPPRTMSLVMSENVKESSSPFNWSMFPSADIPDTACSFRPRRLAAMTQRRGRFSDHFCTNSAVALQCQHQIEGPCPGQNGAQLMARKITYPDFLQNQVPACCLAAQVPAQ